MFICFCLKILYVNSILHSLSCNFRRGAPLPGRHSSGQGSAANRRDEAPNEKGCRKKLSEAKEDISSDESSSSSTTLVLHL